jgi:hypothetical protein
MVITVENDIVQSFFDEVEEQSKVGTLLKLSDVYFIIDTCQRQS